MIGLPALLALEGKFDDAIRVLGSPYVLNLSFYHSFTFRRIFFEAILRIESELIAHIRARGNCGNT